jgi:hypothetical protein
MHSSRRSLSPEEDVIAAILDEADDLDDTLPADLWFRTRVARRPSFVIRSSLS